MYLSPAVAHYQEGVQLFKVIHIILPMKEEYSTGGHPISSIGEAPSHTLKILSA